MEPEKRFSPIEAPQCGHEASSGLRVFPQLLQNMLTSILVAWGTRRSASLCLRTLCKGRSVR